MAVLFLRLLAIYLGQSPLCAQTTGATYLLTRGPGAEGAALGNSIVPTVSDPTALYWNPAGLARTGGVVTGEHLFLYDGARYDFLGLAVPSRLGTFGFGALQLDRSNIVARNAIDDPGTTVSNNQSDYLVGFARSIGERFSAGGTANILNFNLAGYHDMAVGVDVGGQAAYPGPDLLTLRETLWSFGAVMKNLVPPSLRLVDEKETFPRDLRAGLSLSFDTLSRASLDSGVIRSDRAAVSLSFRKVAGEPAVHPGVGVSYSWDRLLVLRVGYDQGVSGGIGLRTVDGRFAFDYALENGPLSYNHRFTVSFRFLRPPVPPAATSREEVDDDYAKALARSRSLSEEYLLKGQAQFRAQRYADAVEPLQAAWLLDPESKEKRAWYERAINASRRDQIQELVARVDAVAPGEEAGAYRALAAALDLKPDDRAALADILRKLPVRLSSDAHDRLSIEAIESRRSEISRLSAAGLTSDALFLIENLEVGESTHSAEAIAFLGREVASAGEARRAQLEAQVADARRSGNPGQELRALVAIQRAYPEDKEVAARVEVARRAVQSKLSLSLRERLYLRRLYLLAAGRFANRDPEAARDLLEEILRSNAADADAVNLEDAIIRSRRGDD